jgi:hypothetical protein
MGSIYKTRGWTLQERSLSPRLLYITAQEAVLECGVSTWHEHSKTRVELRDLPGSAEIGRRINGLMRDLGIAVLPVDSLPRVTLELGLVPADPVLHYHYRPEISNQEWTSFNPDHFESGSEDEEIIEYKRRKTMAARKKERKQIYREFRKDRSNHNSDIQTYPQNLILQDTKESRWNERWDSSSQQTAVANGPSAEILHHRNSASLYTNQHDLDISNEKQHWIFYSEDTYRFLPIYMDLISIYTSRKLSFATDILAAFAGFSSVFEMFSERALICGLPESAFAASLL